MSNHTGTNSNQKGGMIKLISFCQPKLAGGVHTITASQYLEVDPKIQERIKLEDGKIEDLAQTLYISAPRFSLDPQDIHLHYPAHESSDDFCSELPYIVFTKRTLPWERSITRKPTVPPVPWFALAVFVEGEVSETYTAAIKEFCQEEKPENIKGDKPERKILNPLRAKLSKSEKASKGTVHSFLSQVEKQSEELCQYIELSEETFTALMPSLEDLRCLTHVRVNVDMEYKADVAMLNQGAFSVAIANRFPLPGRNHSVHLLSLEGCEQLLEVLPKNREQLLKNREEFLNNRHLDDECEAERVTIRLISLARWSFHCTWEHQRALRQIVSNWVDWPRKDKPRKENTPDDLMLHLPADRGNNPAVKNRLKRGFVPLPYHLMNGADSLAWYRGPLIPVPETGLDNAGVAKALTSASAAMRFDEATGLFDQSYAVAWQLGRSFALADPHFGPQLMNLRRRAHQAVDRLCQLFSSDYIDEILEKLTAFDTAAIESELAERIEDGYFGIDPIEHDGQDDNQIQEIDADFQRNLVDKIERLIDDQLKQSKQITDLFPMGIKAPLENISKTLKDVIDNVLVRQMASELRAIILWIGNLSLTDIPFYYLIPHPELLPEESLRFFYVDENWWHALFDGALSLGIHSRIDEKVYEMIRKRFRDPAQRQQMEEKLNMPNARYFFKDRQKQWGLLLRSKLVQTWSGIEFYATEKDGRPVKPLITQKIDDDLMLFLYEQAPDCLEIREPSEGVRFGRPFGELENYADENKVIKMTGVYKDSAAFAKAFSKNPASVILETDGAQHK